ncbi:MAG: hypothetical protein KDC79_14465 [Cyclobacteriaceae bacterium]|nr:hypothetical protein [Cyclobacteriaceae bacterium]
MTIGATPVTPFLGGFGGIVIYLALQLSQPFLVSFERINGILIKSEILSDRSKYDFNYLALWLKGDNKPFINQYPRDYKNLVVNIDNLMGHDITIWYDNNREIHQLVSNGIAIMDYHWFAPIFLIILAIGLFFHIYAFKETKSKTTNINTYWNMWEYVFGKKVPIMKYNNKPYNLN